MRTRNKDQIVLSEEKVSSETIEENNIEANVELVRSRDKAIRAKGRIRKPVQRPGVYFDTKGTPGYHTRYVYFGSNDSFGKIQYLLEKGYRFVDLNGIEATELVNVGDLTQLRNFVGVPDKYSNGTHYKMQIPIEWYNEDREAEELERRKQDSYIFTERFKNTATKQDQDKFQFSEFYQEKK